ncbi:MAG: thiamine pyrophosphate-dependent enzyme [Desulfovibrionales bacterium]
MVSVEDFGNYETAWCPGCGNFSILRALKKALSGLDIAPHQVLFVSGIGQAAKTPHYLKCNCFNGLHGRGLPPAQAAKLANPGLNVIVESGDGCNYGEGGNHFLAAVRRNVDLTMLVHDNQVYGLTKGQASPTTMEGAKSKSQPFGPPSTPFNPMAVAVAMRASFVARGFSGEIEHLVDLVQQAIQHKGFSLVDIFQPCVSFNKVNTFKWYQEHCYKLEDHDPTDWDAAMEKAMEFGDKIPLGVIYKNDRHVFGSNISTLPEKPLATHTYDLKDIEEIMRSYA